MRSAARRSKHIEPAMKRALEPGLCPRARRYRARKGTGSLPALPRTRLQLSTLLVYTDSWSYIWWLSWWTGSCYLLTRGMGTLMLIVDTHEPVQAYAYINQAVESALLPLNDTGYADYQWDDHGAI